MKIVLDTNVIIAAIATRGICTDLFELCILEHKLILSEPLLEEIKRGLTHKIKLPQALIANILEFIRSETEIVVADKVPREACRDKTDLEILGIAIADQVDAIVIGDKDLLILKQFESIPILSPREFWLFLQKRT